MERPIPRHRPQHHKSWYDAHLNELTMTTTTKTTTTTTVRNSLKHHRRTFADPKAIDQFDDGLDGIRWIGEEALGGQACEAANEA